MADEGMTLPYEACVEGMTGRPLVNLLLSMSEGEFWHPNTIPAALPISGFNFTVITVV